MYNSGVIFMAEGQTKQRNCTIDLLRVIGLVLVISAHCGFSSWFTNARDFDVILLMFVSGVSFALSHPPDLSYRDYVKKRFRKLILPVWVFLTGFFLFFRVLGKTFTLREMAESYLLLAGGVLFVWVYRVFFTSALLNPFLLRLRDRRNAHILSLCTVLLLAFNDLISVFVFSKLGTAGKLLQYLFTYTIAYGLVSFAGIVFEKAERKDRIRIGILYAMAFVFAGALMRFPKFYDCKYPPMLYYCAYGIAWSALLFLGFERFSVSGILRSLITWISVHTMDIFMWHIFAYYLLEWINPAYMDLPWLDFAVFLGGGILGAFLQEKVMKLWKKRRI